VGNNAQGKSNLLEVVVLLKHCDHRMRTRSRLSPEGEATGQITTIERQTGFSDLSLTLRRNGRTGALNSESLRRQLDFLGVLNAVQFSSLDLELVQGTASSGSIRCYSARTVYAYILQQYNQVLRQRNALLKRDQGSGIRIRDPS